MRERPWQKRSKWLRQTVLPFHLPLHPDSAVCSGQNASFSISVGISRYQLSVNGSIVGSQTQVWFSTNLTADTTVQLALLDSSAMVCPATYRIG
jgi:hypothetical protein